MRILSGPRRGEASSRSSLRRETGASLRSPGAHRWEDAADGAHAVLVGLFDTHKGGAPVSDDKRRKILETVKKLIAHEQSASSIGNREEALAFGAKIAQLMREYRIERHEVEPSLMDALDFSEYGITLVTNYPAAAGEQVAWQALLFSVIAESHACQVVLFRDAGHFFIGGQHLDRAVAIALSHLLIASVEKDVELEWCDALYHDPNVYLGKVTEASFRQSYQIGFVQALRERLAEEAEETLDETALIVISRAMTRTQKYLQVRTNGATSGTMDVEIEVKSIRAANAGYTAGMAADLNTNRVGGAVSGRKAINGK